MTDKPAQTGSYATQSQSQTPVDRVFWPMMKKQLAPSRPLFCLGLGVIRPGKTCDSRSPRIYPDEAASFPELEAEAILEALHRRCSSVVPLGASRGTLYGATREGFRRFP